ncbi:hypothetical protein G3I62_27535 [Streptomyces sp. SID14446]|uniref:hypothetical protein n=1 Tax=Streptomyces sp. SID14446 TaxID=2706072 RepID=UPI0013BA9AF4|nr:hypothetical protein [Streptomyces sp. SID14446]NEB32799.1 hypothetical protein [Streptomyces sp. SID14446]
MGDEPVPEATRAYSRALVDAFESLGGAYSRRAFANATAYSPGTVSRYLSLSSDRVAPQEFVDALTAFLADHDHPLTPDQIQRLHELRREAQRTGPRGAVSQYLQEQIATLESDLRTVRESLETALATGVSLSEDLKHRTQQLAVLEIRLLTLSSELRSTRIRAQKAEADNRLLRSTVKDQEEQLKHAGSLVRSVDAELAQQEATVRSLQHEIEVLHQRLGHSAKDTVPAPSTQVHSAVVGASGVEPATERGAERSRSGGPPSEQTTAPQSTGEDTGAHHSTWAHPDDVDQFMQELYRLWQESDASHEALAAHGLAFDRVKEVLTASKLPDLSFVTALARACAADPQQWQTDWQRVSGTISKDPLPFVQVAGEVLLGIIGFFLLTPIRVTPLILTPFCAYLTGASYVALWRVDDGPSWWSLLLATVPYCAMTALGGFILTLLCTGISSITLGDHADAFFIGTVAASCLALFVSLVVTGIGPIGPGVWWAHVLGIL